ncbi:MAG: NADH/ubiquinone/plastoquinone (complex I), partial [Candidatus Marinimicrobia bacterium]|nr:NADH/ubiquinone/plastoquinone (complex I) [Candidatus Neomarinimicrobiota bacterium]
SSTSMIATLSVAGMPPFNGFFSKLIIIIAAVQAAHPGYALIAVVGSLLTLVYFMKVQRYGFRGEELIEKPDVKVGLGMKASMIILAILCVVTSLLVIPGIREVTLDPVVSVITGKTDYIFNVLGR